MSGKRQHAFVVTPHSRAKPVATIFAHNVGHAMCLYRRRYRAPHLGSELDGSFKGYSIKTVGQHVQSLRAPDRRERIDACAA